MGQKLYISESEKERIFGLYSEQRFGGQRWWHNQPPIEEQLEIVKPDAGKKYCFSQKKLDQLLKEQSGSLLLYKIKKNDKLEKLTIENGGPAHSMMNIVYSNDVCPELKSGKGNEGDVIIFSITPTG